MEFPAFAYGGEVFLGPATAGSANQVLRRGANPSETLWGDAPVTLPGGLDGQLQYNGGSGQFNGVSGSYVYGVTGNNVGLEGELTARNIVLNPPNTIGIKLNLAAGQTANAIEVNSSGGSGGDRFKVAANGDITVTSSNWPTITLLSTSGNGGTLDLRSGSNSWQIYNHSGVLKINNGGLDHVHIESVGGNIGNVALGRDLVTAIAQLHQKVPALDVTGHRIDLAVSQTAPAIEVRNSANATVFRVAATGALSVTGGIGTDGPITTSNTITAGSHIQTGAVSAFYWTGLSIIKSPADGVIRLTNNAEADFNRLQFGGTTNAFPALKRNLTALECKLADDSAFAPFKCGTFDSRASGYPNSSIQFTDGYGGITSGPVIQITSYAGSHTGKIYTSNAGYLTLQSANDSGMIFFGSGDASININGFVYQAVSTNKVGHRLDFAVGQLVDMAQWNPAASLPGERARITKNGEFSHKGLTGANSEQFGEGAVARGQDSLAVGNNATTGAGNSFSVALGRNSSAVGYGSTCVGYSANSAGVSAYSVAIGHSAGVITNQYAIAIGTLAVCGGIGIGGRANVTVDSGIGMGYNVYNASANHFVAGSDSSPINDIYFGQGILRATPTSYTIHGTNSTGAAAGGDVRIVGGSSASGTAGNVILCHDGTAARGNVLIGTLTGTGSKLFVVGTSSPFEGDRVASFFDNNLQVGVNVTIGWTGGGVNGKYKSFVVDSAGFGIGRMTDTLVSAPTVDFRIDNTGNVAIGSLTASAKLQVIHTLTQLRIGYNAANYFNVTVDSAGATAFETASGQSFTFQGARSGATFHTYISNTSNSTVNNGTALNISVADLNSGDPYISFGVTGASVWYMGVDNSDGDKFKIAYGSQLGTGDTFMIDGAGVVQFGTFAALAGETLNGYITIRDKAGTTRKLAVIA